MSLVLTAAKTRYPAAAGSELWLTILYSLSSPAELRKALIEKVYW